MFAAAAAVIVAEAHQQPMLTSERLSPPQRKEEEEEELNERGVVLSVTQNFVAQQPEEAVTVHLSTTVKNWGWREIVVETSREV